MTQTAIAKWEKFQRVQGLLEDGDPGDKTADSALSLLPATKLAESGNFSKLLVEIARKEIGVREDPIDSNKGKRVQEYQATTWLEGTGWPWCAAFICFLIKEAMEQYDEEVKFNRPRTAGAWDFEKWALERSGGKDSGVILIKPPKIILAGDILIYTFSHIGLAETDESRNAVEAIEGNTDTSGSREGGGVYDRIRRKDQIRSVIRISV